jgi:Icc-related predicted phosphoesterase
MPDQTPFRIAAMSDLHYDRHSGGKLQSAFDRASEEADVLLLCGDLTDYGLPEEAELLARDVREHVKIPVLAVLGNHDYETGHIEEIREIFEAVNIDILDGSCTMIDGVGFAGVRGFAGGFGRWALSAWGEPSIKAFVQEAVEESLKLDKALSRLSTPYRIVLMHYSPIRGTVEGEPEEIIPFLGSGRLEDPLDRHEATVVFHGHAHAGAPEGATTKGIPVFNVSIPLLQKAYPDAPPYRIFEVDRNGSAKGDDAKAS